MPDFDYVIIGNSAAGVGGVEGVRKHDARGSIAVVGDESVMPYPRCLLTSYIAGKVSEKNLTYRPPKFYERNNVNLFLGRRAVRLDVPDRKVLLDDGTELGYGRLLLATGSSAVLQDLHGKDLPGVHVLRTVLDAQRISGEAATAKRAAVMGGGLVGVGSAIALRQRGLRTHLVVASSQVLSQNIDRGAAEMVAKHLIENGIELVLDTDVREILGASRVTGVRLSDGQVLECDLVVSAKGVRMNSDLAIAAGLQVGRGVIVDERMRTSAPGVYAAGDVAEAKEFLSGRSTTLTIWPIAAEQGRVAGENMAGAEVDYPGGVQMNTVDFIGMPVVSLGEAREPKDPSGLEFIVDRDDAARRYRKLVLREGRIVGAILVGDTSQAGTYTSMPCTKVDVRAVRGLLLKDSFDYAKLVDTLLVKDPALPSR